MASLNDRLKKEKESSPTKKAVEQITGVNKKVKTKYPVNVVFDGEVEEQIRERAKSYGVGVATYIKMLVSRDLQNENKC